MNAASESGALALTSDATGEGPRGRNLDLRAGISADPDHDDELLEPESEHPILESDKAASSGDGMEIAAVVKVEGAGLSQDIASVDPAKPDRPADTPSKPSEEQIRPEPLAPAKVKQSTPMGAAAVHRTPQVLALPTPPKQQSQPQGPKGSQGKGTPSNQSFWGWLKSLAKDAAEGTEQRLARGLQGLRDYARGHYESAMRRIRGGASVGAPTRSVAPENPPIDAVSQELARLQALSQQLGGKNLDQNEEKGKGRDDLVAGIARVRGQVAALDGAGLDPAALADVKAHFYRALQDLSPYYAQLRNVDILENNKKIGQGIKTRTCNITSLAMSLESLGKSANDYKGDQQRILAVAQVFQPELAKADLALSGAGATWDAMVGLRLPDFLELVAIAECLGDIKQPSAKDVTGAAPEGSPQGDLTDGEPDGRGRTL